VLLAVIFRCENAPDSQTGFEPGISQNISAVFSRISAILGVGTPSQEDSLRRRRGAGKRAGFCTGFVGNFISRKTALCMPGKTTGKNADQNPS